MWKITFLAWVTSVSSLCYVVQCNVPCTETSTCEELVRPGSVCMDGGICSNPFASGCLRNYLGDDFFPNKRTCNSDDPPGAAEAGVCVDTVFDYQEIRILGQNWDSAIVNAWILQILLSELLNVPTSVEGSAEGKNLNFYEQPTKEGFDHYGAKSYDFDALYKAAEVGDCRQIKPQKQSQQEYVSCAHILVEGWSGQRDSFSRVEQEGIIEPPTPNGMVGTQGWYVPKFVVDSDSTLVYHNSLSGDENRLKVAKAFGRPTTWKEYCDNVALKNCSKNDGIAVRTPQNPTEEGQYFVPGLYHGYFRFTEQNDCDRNFTECTGHIVDYPCDWSTFVTPLAYHNDIALESNGPLQPNGGYSYQEMLEIWAASDATQSNALFMWFHPDMLYQSFLDTDSEMTPIVFPRPSQECVSSRVTEAQRCSSNYEERVGSPLGACDLEPDTLLKLIVSNLYDTIYSAPGPLRSPAYDVLRAYSISELQIGQIFDYWQRLNKNQNSNFVDRNNWRHGPREAVCQWVAENLDFLEGFIPRTYPRVLHDDCFIHGKGMYETPFVYIAFSLGLLVSVLVILTGVATYCHRKDTIIIYAQIDFLYMLLAGLLVTCAGAIVVAMEPSQASCVTSAWFITMGYTMQLSPLVVKVAATNTMLQAAKKMKRVTLRRTDLYRNVFQLCFLAIILLSLWTYFDPPTRAFEVTMASTTGESTTTTTEGLHDHELHGHESHVHGLHEHGDVTVVNKSYFCSSDTSIGQFVSVAWLCFLLLIGTVLAFQTRNLREDFNESKTLGFLTYSHFMFVVLLLITFVLEQSVSRGILVVCRSVVYSLDSLVALGVYFVPKLFQTLSGKGEERMHTSSEFFTQGKNATKDTTFLESTIVTPYDEIRFRMMQKIDEEQQKMVELSPPQHQSKMQSMRNFQFVVSEIQEESNMAIYSNSRHDGGETMLLPSVTKLNSSGRRLSSFLSSESSCAGDESESTATCYFDMFLDPSTAKFAYPSTRKLAASHAGANDCLSKVEENSTDCDSKKFANAKEENENSTGDESSFFSIYEG